MTDKPIRKKQNKVVGQATKRDGKHILLSTPVRAKEEWVYANDWSWTDYDNRVSRIDCSTIIIGLGM